MRIERLEIRYVSLPLIYPWRTAYGADAAIDSVLLHAYSEGHDAWAETTPLRAPTYSPEFTLGVYSLLGEILAPLLVGQEFQTPDALLDRLSPIKGNPFAKAGLEMTWWALQAKIKGRPLHELLGGTRRDVEAGADFGIQDSIEMLLSKIQTAIDRGYTRIKLKFGPGWELDMLKAVRSTYLRHTFHIDCNAAYTLDHLPMFKEIDTLNLAMIEQPLHHADVLEHAELQKHLETPICLDESIKSARDFETALKLGACRVLNIKPGRVGGLSVATRLHDLARDAGIPCWVGSMLESGVGMGILIELATLSNFVYPGDLFPSAYFYTQDLTEPPVTLNEDCTFTPSSAPGTPYEPVPARVEAATKLMKVVEAH
jgi:O-succinylbenzoate synthase